MQNFDEKTDAQFLYDLDAVHPEVRVRLRKIAERVRSFDYFSPTLSRSTPSARAIPDPLDAATALTSQPSYLGLIHGSVRHLVDDYNGIEAAFGSPFAVGERWTSERRLLSLAIAQGRRDRYRNRKMEDVPFRAMELRQAWEEGWRRQDDQHQPATPTPKSEDLIRPGDQECSPFYLVALRAGIDVGVVYRLAGQQQKMVKLMRAEKTYHLFDPFEELSRCGIDAPRQMVVYQAVVRLTNEFLDRQDGKIAA